MCFSSKLNKTANKPIIIKVIIELLAMCKNEFTRKFTKLLIKKTIDAVRTKIKTYLKKTFVNFLFL